jgi:hypothetical protein
MQDFEKLGVFYIGRPYDLQNQKPMEGALLYNSKDMVTHSICIGMTGSGKTGLCIDLIEEAALDGIPAVIIDPKGDITNLLLTFPELKPEDFLPWINQEDAAKKGLTPADYAAQQADFWRKGLESWGQGSDRLRLLRKSAEFLIYTPGSSAGIPVSILKSFSVPPPEILEDAELLQERIGTTVTSLLALMGVDADPIRSREHILLSTIFTESWRKRQDISLTSLIGQIQKPPFTRVGVLDLESFFPQKERFQLAMMMNNLLAAPGFQLWLEGEPLDIQKFLYSPAGKPKISIFYTAHLSDSERMFFTSLLLNHLIGWMRSQSGTTSLRALLYIDEVFGYLPPVANPPSKKPLLTLLKQARAFGLGVMLATQNPVDLDYKAASNAGTWFIGRLQTERDKARILDALDSVSANTANQIGREEADRIISSLGKRIFLMHNVNEKGPVVFETRWTMSYLRGPLMRSQIKSLMDPVRPSQPEAGAPQPVAQAAKAPTEQQEKVTDALMLPPEVEQYFIPPQAYTGSRPMVYRPKVLGIASVRFTDAKSKLDAVRDYSFLSPITDDAFGVNWGKSQESKVGLSDLAKTPVGKPSFAELPPIAMKPKSYAAWQKDYALWLQQTAKMMLFRSPALNEYSRSGESESDFRIRMQQASRELRDQNMEKLREKYEARLLRIDERLRKAEAAIEKQEFQKKEQKYQTAVSVGSTLLGAVLGRRYVSGAKTTARDIGRTLKKGKDIEAAQADLKALQKERARLEDELESEVKAMEKKIDPVTEKLDAVPISPSKTSISVKMVVLAWDPN